MILVTGAAGFIGFHLIKSLTRRCDPATIIGVDNFNPYYDPRLKRSRAEILRTRYGVTILEVDIADFGRVRDVFERPFEIVIHLAAQAGVRYSIENPAEYVRCNLVGFGNVLECARTCGCGHLVYASSSSVYGNDSPVPFRESEPFRSLESLYAVTKASNEMAAEVYAKIYGMTLTGLRFFTVYGSWGRPDMAYYSFAESIRSGRPIRVFNNGKLSRDFTHISDIVSGIQAVVDRTDKQSPNGRSRVYNIGRGEPVELLEFIGIIENEMGRKAIKEFVPMQLGDVHATWADISALRRDYGYNPKVSLADGIREFLNWYNEYRI